MEAPALRIRLLGELDLRQGEASLPPLESARAASLLAYLLLHRKAPQSRQRLAFLLWPDSTESQARTNLRHVLHILRRALPDPDRFLEVTSRTLQWRTDAPFWLDVAAFEALLARAERDPAGGGLASLREAVELYTGDLLEGADDEWLLPERERLRRRGCAALEHLTALLGARGDYAQAIPYAERLLRYDPLHEETYRLLMRLHDARGDRARALRVYHVCATTLERELGIEPSPETREAYEALLPVKEETAAGARPAGRAGRSPLIGRAAEWRRLTALWRACETSGAQFVLVTGEPGIGKTRLVEEFRAWCGHRGAVSAEARSYAAEGALAYGPVVAWLRSKTLKAHLPRLDPGRLTELTRLLPELGTEIPGLARPEPLPEHDQRQRLFDAIARAILASGGPLLLVADDLHWCDRETLQFLHYLIRVEPQTRLLVAATARREEIDHQHPLADLRAGLYALGRLTELDLGRLSREETAVLAERLAGHPLDEPAAEQLYRETEGNALFVVEALRAGWTSGHAGREWLSPRVQVAIESRLAQLSEPARELVGVAATVGREFTIDVLGYASQADADTLMHGLDELWRRRIVREQGADAYDFSHDKIREVAYLALSPARRRHHHLRVAHALEQRYADDPSPVSGQLAAHCERAGVTDQAVTWYERAAETAQQMHAHSEAVRLLSRALDLLRTLPETPERNVRELELLTAVPGPLVAVEGYASSRLAAVQRRAHELARVLGIEPAPPLLRSLALANLSTGDFEAARRSGEQMRARGERDGDAVLRVEAEYVLGIAAFWSGELEAARKRFEAAVEHYRPEHRRAHLLRYGNDPKAVCLTRLACALWFLGHPEAATRARDAGLVLAEEIGHPFTRRIAFTFAALLSLETREPERVRAYVASLAAVPGEREVWHDQTVLEALLGFVEVLDGRAAAGITRIQRVIAAAPMPAPTPGHHAILQRVLLEACVVAGDMRAGLAAADQAFGLGGVRLWDAEVRQLRAEFLAALGAGAEDVEAELARALEVARRQGARMLELRAAVSLLHHRLEHGDNRAVAEARDYLAAIVAALPEAQDAWDLREASRVLSRV